MKSAPNPLTDREWHLALHQILDGAYGDLTEILGSVDEVVRVAIRNSSDPSACRANFELAFREVVRMWDPNEPAREETALRMLDLIEAFTPEIALTKILGQLERAGDWPVALPAEIGKMAPSEFLYFRARSIFPLGAP